MESVRYAHHPRYRGVIFRRDYPRLSELMDRAWQWLPTTLGAHWNGDDHAWVFPAGGRLRMRHCQYEETKYAYNGHEYQFMGFDQLEEFTESQYDFLLAQNRSGVADLEPYTRSTFNPGGIGHGWVKKRFIDHGTVTHAPWRPVNEVGTPLSTRCFHRSGIDDNPAGNAADPSYRRRLEALPEQERRALLEGDWDVFAGQYFTEWRREIHVCKPFAIPPDWPRWRGVDYGYHAPFCCLWLTRSPDRQIYVYRELYATGMTDAEQALHIRGLSGNERIAATFGDPSMWNHDGGSLGTVYANNGVPLVPANNDRVAGWQTLRRQLQEEPVLQVFETCLNLIRTLPALVYDPQRVEDLDTDGEDHAADALRYALMGARQFQHPAGGTTKYGYGR